MPHPKLPSAPPIPQTDLLTFLFSEKPSNPNRPIFVSADNPELSYTRAQCRDLIQKLIAGLRAHPSFSPGTTVLIHSLNTVLYPILILAIIGAGGISAHTNPAYTPYELEHAVRITRGKIVLCEPETETLQPMLKAMLTNNLNPETDLLILDSLPEHSIPNRSPPLRSYRALLSHRAQRWTTFSKPEQSTTTIAALFLSSGTTGLPKPVPLAHHNLISQHQLIHAPYNHLRSPTSPAVLPGYRNSASESLYGGGPVLIIAAPMFHIGVSNLTFVTGVKEARTSVMVRRFDTRGFLDAVERHRCNEGVVVPPMVNAFVSLAAQGPEQEALVRRKLATLRYALLGAAPLGGPMQRELQELMGGALGAGREKGVRFGQLWGMTELSCIVSCVPPDPRISEGYEYEGSVGWAMPGIEIEAFDPDTRKEVEAGRVGELWVRSPTGFRGYFGDENQKANEEAFAEGTDGKGKWLRSGDLGRQDPETGLWWIVGRVKELIKVRGFQVSPAEVEEAMRGLHGLVDVAVVGVEAARRGDGEAPRAFVVRRPGSDGDALTEDTVKEFVRSRLSRFKWLEGGVVFVDAIPRNASGKILRRILKQMPMSERPGESKL